jgi:hypothetical protein
VTEYTKISFQHRRIREIGDVTDIVAMFFPGNRNQQYAAARILMTLRTSTEPVPSLAHLEALHGISRRKLQRARAKLARLGLIEHVSGLNTRYAGAHGWRLSGRMGTALRALADRLDTWRYELRHEQLAKEEALVNIIR